MQVRVCQHFLIPGVEHSQKAEAGAQPAWIAGNAVAVFLKHNETSKL